MTDDERTTPQSTGPSTEATSDPARKPAQDAIPPQKKVGMRDLPEGWDKTERKSEGETISPTSTDTAEEPDDDKSWVDWDSVSQSFREKSPASTPVPEAPSRYDIPVKEPESRIQNMDLSEQFRMPVEIGRHPLFSQGCTNADLRRALQEEYEQSQRLISANARLTEEIRQWHDRLGKMQIEHEQEIRYLTEQHDAHVSEVRNELVAQVAELRGSHDDLVVQAAEATNSRAHAETVYSYWEEQVNDSRDRALRDEEEILRLKEQNEALERQVASCTTQQTQEDDRHRNGVMLLEEQIETLERRERQKNELVAVALQLLDNYHRV